MSKTDVSFRQLFEKTITLAQNETDRIKDSYSRDHALAGIAMALAKIKDFGKASKTAGKIRYSCLRAETLTFIAGVSRKVEDFDKARKSADEASDVLGYWRDKFLLRIAKELAKAKHFDKARKAADKISYDDKDRAEALATIALLSKEPKYLDEALKIASKGDNHHRAWVLGSILRAIAEAM